jgi:hypothetical protein
MANLWISSRLALSVILRTRSRTANLSRFFWRSGSGQVWLHERVTTRKPKQQLSGHARCVVPRPRDPLMCTDDVDCNPDGEACDGMRALRTSFVPLISALSDFLSFFLSLFHCIFLSPLLTIFPLLPCRLGLVTSSSLLFTQLVSSQSMAI